MDVISAQISEVIQLGRNAQSMRPPAPLDCAFAKIADAYISQNTDTRTMIHNGLHGYSYVLWACSIRSCELALKQNEPVWVTRGLIALVIEEFQEDPRENLIRLAAVWYSAKYLGIKPDKLFSQIASLAGPKAQQAILAFSLRSEKSKTLRAMGTELVREDDQFYFRLIPPPWQRKTERRS